MTLNPRILIVEDDREIGPLVRSLLLREGFEAEWVRSGSELDTALARQRADLLVLDLMLPGEDGLSVCRRIQGAVPVLIASARGEPMDRIVGLEVGADDYVAKPFVPRELVARIKALLRRRDRAEPRPPARRLAFGGWRLDLASRALTDADGQAVELTGGEFDLLAAFVRRPQQVLSRDDIMDVLKGRQADVFDRSIDIQVSRLRRKLGDHPRESRLIRTVRNAGYLFTADVEVQS